MGLPCRRRIQISRKGAKTQRMNENTRKPEPFTSFFASLRLCVSFDSRFSAKPATMVKILSLTALLLAALPALAQRKSDEPPIVGRPADFSNVVGKYTIHASA